MKDTTLPIIVLVLFISLSLGGGYVRANNYFNLTGSRNLLSPIGDIPAYAENKTTEPEVQPVKQESGEDGKEKLDSVDGRLSWSEVAKLIIDEFSDLGPKVTMEALDISKCESGWREDAYNDKNKNGSNDGGVFQLNSIHGLPDEIRFNAKQNIKWAKEKYLRDKSWGAWSCRKVL
jgi:hypothetical protein